jgi:hypothetical protein
MLLDYHILSQHVLYIGTTKHAERRQLHNTHTKKRDHTYLLQIQELIQGLGCKVRRYLDVQTTWHVRHNKVSSAAE